MRRRVSFPNSFQKLGWLETPYYTLQWNTSAPFSFWHKSPCKMQLPENLCSALCRVYTVHCAVSPRWSQWARKVREVVKLLDIIALDIMSLSTIALETIALDTIAPLHKTKLKTSSQLQCIWVQCSADMQCTSNTVWILKILCIIYQCIGHNFIGHHFIEQYYIGHHCIKQDQVGKIK